MKQLLFFWTGSFRPADNSKLNFAKLAITGRNSGTINYQDADRDAPDRRYNECNSRDDA